jgi:hypothetical protein
VAPADWVGRKSRIASNKTEANFNTVFIIKLLVGTL